MEEDAATRMIKRKYDIVYKVGEGTYGIVYKATSMAKPHETVAIKQFKTPHSKESEGISVTAIREIMLLRELNHENIVRVKEFLLDALSHSLSLVFDYAEYDLYEVIKYHRDVKQRPSDFAIKSYLWQMVNGIHYLHSNWVLHRDLKPSNILVNGVGAEEGRIKIADFGLARVFKAPMKPLSDNGVVVTIWYRAPELLLSSNHYTRAIDVWALGCIFAELFLTKPLFPGNTKAQNQIQDQLDKIYAVLGPPNAARWPGLMDMPDWGKFQVPEDRPNVLAAKMAEMRKSSHAAFDLLSRMIDYNPDTRITASEILDHEYFKEQPLPSLNAFDDIRQAHGQLPYPSRKATQ